MGAKAALKGLLSRVSAILVKCNILPSRIIINMDGGICSQMHFFLVGKIIADAHRTPVTYDLSWFEECGKDTDGKFSRNFDLLKMFPNLDFIVQRRGFLRKIYISAFYKWNDYKSESASYILSKAIEPPCFLDGYFKDPEIMFSKWFPEMFHIDTSVLPDDNREILRKIENSSNHAGSCAVHVRRGDLSKEHPIYGTPCKADYYKEGFRIVESKFRGTKFFIFSDEPEWFRQNIMPLLPEYDIEIVEINGSDRGWCDLILMSRCRSQITSQGSMGKYASMLRDDSDGVVILPSNEFSREWLGRIPDSIIME